MGPLPVVLPATKTLLASIEWPLWHGFLPERDGRGHTLFSLSQAERGPREPAVGPGKGSHYLSACTSGAHPAKQHWQDARALRASGRVTGAFGIPGYSLPGSMSRLGAGCPGGPCHTPSAGPAGQDTLRLGTGAQRSHRRLPLSLTCAVTVHGNNSNSREWLSRCRVSGAQCLLLWPWGLSLWP